MPFRFLRLYLPLTVLACLLIATVTHNGLSNQDPAKQPTQSASQLPERISDQTYRVSVDLVNVLCSAFDKNTNSFVTNLTQDDFSVYEDGQKQEIKNFARETNMPLTIAMLIDTSDSVAPKLKFEQEAAISFFQSILREKDRAMLVEFDYQNNLVPSFPGVIAPLEELWISWVMKTMALKPTYISMLRGRA